jgi:uncharacterized protein YecE (DUF72 family)
VVDYYIGTMGFSYRDWEGVFYPPGISASDYLTYYGRIFNAVEIDSTFYGTPRRGTVIRWRESTPVGFKICVKVPRVITHESGLADRHVEMQEFLESIRYLDDKLGVIIFQFPPSYDSTNLETFDEFMRHLPREFEFGAEFRHLSWYQEQTSDLLAKHGICWVATEFEGVPKEVQLTSDLIFMRFIGKHGQFRRHDQEQLDVSSKLNWWRAWIQSRIEQVAAVYGFFNDDFSGYAPAAANHLKEMLGLPVKKPNIPKQMRFL